jgi:dTDP-4-dehydrorhamnose 3,5-epimerase
MKAIPLAIPDVMLIEPEVFGDARGFFLESFNRRKFEQVLGRPVDFVQHNQSGSVKNVLRGLHYQIRQVQAKLVRVQSGTIFDLAVDLRRASPTFGQHVSALLSADSRKALWIPEGFAHGFAVLSDFAEVAYLTTDYWAAEHERCIIWNDPALGIDWPLKAAPILSDKDGRGLPLALAEVFA